MLLGLYKDKLAFKTTFLVLRVIVLAKLDVFYIIWAYLIYRIVYHIHTFLLLHPNCWSKHSHCICFLLYKSLVRFYSCHQYIQRHRNMCSHSIHHYMYLHTDRHLGLVNTHLEKIHINSQSFWRTPKEIWTPPII